MCSILIPFVVVVFLFIFFVFFFFQLPGYNFGECQDGAKVNNVKLPPWADGKARLFILKHRQVKGV